VLASSDLNLARLTLFLRAQMEGISVPGMHSVAYMMRCRDIYVANIALYVNKSLHVDISTVFISFVMVSGLYYVLS